MKWNVRHAYRRRERERKSEKRREKKVKERFWVGLVVLMSYTQIWHNDIANTIRVVLIPRPSVPYAFRSDDFVFMGMNV